MYGNLIQDKVTDFEVVVGLKEADKPEMINFKNYELAINMLNKHVTKPSSIRIHADVDMDGIGAAYIVQEFLNELGCVGRIKSCINKDKEHGLCSKHINYVNDNAKCDLFIIVDSSSNDIEIIKELNCDVLVIDHHAVNHKEYTGKTKGGNYVIINNMLDNEEGGYKADSAMSGALVVYELFRHYENRYCDKSILEGRMLYQWVGVTLISDVIKTSNNRNQWYMQKTVHNMDVEPSLSRMLHKLTQFEAFLTKSFIGFTLAPLFNKAIRAGASQHALSIALGFPDRVLELKQYEKIQQDIVEKALDNVEETSNLCFRNLGIDNIHKNYSGLIATKVLDEYKKSTIAYEHKGTYIGGSFRGLYSNINYQEELEKLGIFAQGHEGAFGVKIPLDRVKEVSNKIADIEKDNHYRPYLTMCGIREDYRGVHHINDFDSFRKDGWLWKIGMANSTLSSSEQILITTSRDNITLERTEEKYKIYKFFTLECMAFEEVVTPFVNIYLEYGKELRAFLRKETNLK